MYLHIWQGLLFVTKPHCQNMPLFTRRFSCPSAWNFNLASRQLNDKELNPIRAAGTCHNTTRYFLLPVSWHNKKSGARSAASSLSAVIYQLLKYTAAYTSSPNFSLHESGVMPSPTVFSATICRSLAALLQWRRSANWRTVWTFVPTYGR